jgi:hypothetical protein
MYISQAFIVLSTVATRAVAQYNWRLGDNCRRGVWGCGFDSRTPFVGQCDSRGIWTAYDWCNGNSVCDSIPGERPRCIDRPRSARSYRPGDSCESGIWGCGITRDNVPYVGTCSSSSRTWIIYEVCDNGEQECYSAPGVRPRCASVVKKE